MNRILEVGYALKLSGKEFIIKDIVGKGASSVTYLAEHGKTEHILKECNPLGIDMHRNETGELVADTELNKEKFEESLERFKAGADKQLSFRLTEDLKNPTSNIQGIYYANGTAYIDMTYFGGKTYDKVDGESLYDLFRRIKALAQIVGHYHKMGYLHLDIKPQNIYTIPETPEMIMMFDFDSVTPINDIDAIISSSYTDVWAAPEQKMTKYRNQICEATDLFAIGEIIFYKLFDRHSAENDRYSFSQYEYSAENKWFENINPRVFPMITELLHKTLSCSAKKRYQNMEQLVLQLDKIIELSNPKEPFLKSSLPNVSGFFTGRDVEIEEIHKRLQENNVLFLSGIGGIGKSELAKRYANKYKDKYDAIIFAPFVNDVQMMITDENCVPIYNFSQYPEEKSFEYFARKMRKIGELCDKRTLIIVDNLDTTEDENLNKLFQLECKMLVTTRMDFSDVYPDSQINIAELSNPFEIFKEHYKKSLTEEEQKCVEEIIEIVCGHTMTVELLAKQMMAGRVKPEKMLEKLKDGGISESGKEKISHANEKGEISRENTYSHVQALFDLSKLDEEEKYVLANLSLIPYTGISAELFKEWCEISSFDTVNVLATEGWIRRDEDKDYISLHPVIRDIVKNTLPLETLCLKFLHHVSRKNTLNGLLTRDNMSLIYILKESLQQVINYDFRTEQAADYLRVISNKIKNFVNVDIVKASYEKALNIRLDLFGKIHSDVAVSYHYLASLYSEIGNVEKAEKYCNEALNIKKQLYGVESKSYIYSLFEMGIIYKLQAKYDTALDIFEEIKQYYENLEEVYYYGIFRCYTQIGDIYSLIGNYSEAINVFQSILKYKTEKYGIDSAAVASVYYSLSIIYRKLGDLQKAIDYGEKALKIRMDKYEEFHTYVAMSYSSLGLTYMEFNNIEKAQLYLEKALTIRKALFGNDHQRVAISYYRMGMLYEKICEYQLAKSAYQQAFEIRTRLFGKDHIDTIESKIKVDDMDSLIYRKEENI